MATKRGAEEDLESQEAKKINVMAPVYVIPAAEKPTQHPRIELRLSDTSGAIPSRTHALALPNTLAEAELDIIKTFPTFYCIEDLDYESNASLARGIAFLENEDIVEIDLDTHGSGGVRALSLRSNKCKFSGDNDAWETYEAMQPRQYVEDTIVYDFFRF